MCRMAIKSEISPYKVGNLPVINGAIWYMTLGGQDNLIKVLPFQAMITYPTKREQENHRLKTCFGKEHHVSSQEGISDTFEKHVVPYYVFL